MDYYEIVNRLIGSIEPYGSSHIDEKRFENLKEMTYLVERLVDDLKTIAEDNKNRQEHSMKEMGQYADNFLKNVLNITK